MSGIGDLGKTQFDVRRSFHPNAGLPKDHLSGKILGGEHRALMADSLTRPLIDDDLMSIPAAADRENYYGERHLEYWLSGLLDSQKLGAWLPAEGATARYLDFGGCTGRVARHMTRRPGLAVWLCDINANWIAWVDEFFVPPIAAFQNRIFPSLPISDGYFDLVSAFSVFTHFDHDEIPWLLELRRIVRPGGYIYATVIDEHVWDRLTDPAWEWLLNSVAAGRHKDMLVARAAHELTGRVVLERSSAEAYNFNVFLPRKYLTAKWGRFFNSIEFFQDHHAFQTVVALQVP